MSGIGACGRRAAAAILAAAAVFCGAAPASTEELPAPAAVSGSAARPSSAVILPSSVAPAGFLPGDTEETVILEDGPVSIAGRLRVHLEGPAGSVPSAFGPEPDKRFFSRLPVDARGGFGAALRGEPFSSSAVWIAFSTRNATAGEFWALVADGAGFRPTAMVLVSEDGGREFFSGDALDRLRYHTGIADVAAYLIRQAPGKRLTVYFRLQGGGSFGSGLRLWPMNALLSRNERIVGFSSALAGFALAVCIAYALAAVITWRQDEAGSTRSRIDLVLRLVYAACAWCAIVLGRNGGNASALPCSLGCTRFAAATGFMALALAAEAAIAYRTVVERRSGDRLPDWDSVARLALPRLVFAAILFVAAFSTRSPYASFLLPAGLALFLCASTVAELTARFRTFGTSLDVAERRASKLELEARGGRDFMTATAAALRGPLHGLIGILDTLETAISRTPMVSLDSSSDLALARAEAARLENLVSNILSYSGMGPSRLTVEDLDVASVARSAAGLLRVSLAGKGIRIEVDAPLVEVRSDVGFVHRLLYTAMNRAARTPGTTTVRVTASSNDRGVAVRVVDDGDDSLEAFRAGSPVPDMDRVVMTRLSGLLGGSFDFSQSGGLNVHALYLPRSAPAGAADREGGLPGRGLFVPGPFDLQAGSPADPARAAGKVLVAGNEPVALIATRRRLEAYAWLVDVTVSARDALGRVLGGQPYDIVIIDSSMPEMSGFEFCKALRASRNAESVPVIVLTEAGRADEIEMAFRSGANDYIARPASGIELAARVKTHVDLASSIKRELSQAARMAEFDKYRTLAMLSAGVAHEINTPNNAVLRNVPMLKEIWSALDSVVERLHREESGFSVRGFGYDDLKRDIPDMLNDLYMGAQDIKKIVEGLKDYARAPSDSPVMALVDVNDCIRYASRLLKHSIAVSTGRFDMVLAPELPLVRADRLKLTQVVVNVLENAIQALPDRRGGVRIATTTERRGSGQGFIVIRVDDEGTGMSPETLALVFEPFFTTKRDRGGSGLGMAVVSGIVHELGGSIELSSELGAGTTATISLPAAGHAEDGNDGR